jgi:hypothetical protein
MISRDDYIVAILEELQDDLFTMDEEEIYDVLQFVIELLVNEE